MWTLSVPQKSVQTANTTTDQPATQECKTAYIPKIVINRKEPPCVQGKTQEKPPILIFPNTNAVPNEEGKHNVCEAPLKMGLQT